LQKKKEMQSVQEQLEKKRMEFAKRMEECREKQEELRSKVPVIDVAKANQGASAEIREVSKGERCEASSS
jgi:phage shock protein A